MNNGILVLVLLLLILPGCKEQEKSNVIPLNEELTNLNLLDHIFEDKRIVFLGEPSHGDGTIFEARVAMIKYLHETHGFNNIVFESNYYDAEKVNDLNSSGNLSASDFKNATFDIWGNVRELDDLWDYIIQEKDLKFRGMDFQPHHLMKTHFVQDLEKVIDLDDREKKILSEILLQICGTTIEKRKSTASDDELEILVNIREQLSKDGANKKLITGINSILNYLKLYNIDSSVNFWAKQNFRDSIMFENLKIIANDNEKIIVWLASAHGLESPKHLTDTEDLTEINASYSDYIPVGMLSKKKFRDSQLNIAFTGYEGAFRDFTDGKNYDFQLDTYPSMEKTIVSKYNKPTYLSLSQIDSAFHSGILGYEPILADWAKNFDAMIIFPVVEPSTFKN
ncbi:erythromycin esterase family protein [Algoriphagus terrigena]|uniref:erythromycin esterase family protein n=1 Tax=Algoriphagus terrigena TaxID=344884 RepID=UPI000400EF5D|nr:erythromycin esterase family protein [Algoriphagus terrigena]